MDLDRYRSSFRRKVIPQTYNGSAHILIFCMMELAAIIVSGSLIRWNQTAVLMTTISLMQASVLTYFLHRYLLHKRVPGFHWAHKMHHWHHTFYRSDRMTYDKQEDLYMLLMPPWLQGVYFVVYLPLATYLLTLVFSAQHILPFIFGLILWYGIYEFIHWCEHLNKDHFLMRLKIFEKLRRHHILHHSELKDTVNFGIVEPSMDYLFGTKK